MLSLYCAFMHCFACSYTLEWIHACFLGSHLTLYNQKVLFIFDKPLIYIANSVVIFSIKIVSNRSYASSTQAYLVKIAIFLIAIPEGPYAPEPLTGDSI